MRYRFTACELDTDTRELRRGSEVVEVEPQVFDVLAYLVSNHDRVVTKEELLDNVWGDRFVSESALTTRIKQARQAVGDTGREQKVIKTAHGHGYRFVALVDERTAAPLEPSMRAVPGSIPRTHYADADGASIAYQSFGEGPDVVFIAGFTTNVEVQWEHPGIAEFLRRLGSFCRVTILDKRGVGLSERMPYDAPAPLEARADDVRAVMDAAGIERATILGSSEGGMLSALFAATHPDRVERLVLHGTFLVASDRPVVTTESIDIVSRHWGKGVVLSFLGPTLGADDAGRAILARLERQAATPRAARQLLELGDRIDVSSTLDAIKVPTLVLHRVGDEAVPISHGVEVAARIEGARFVELEGRDHWIFSGNVESLLGTIEEFVTGAPASPAITDRLLATVLMIDIADSTNEPRALVRRRVKDAQHAFGAVCERVVSEHRGELVRRGHGRVVATFDGPGRAVHAAAAIRAAAAPLGLLVQGGLHTAEIERRGADISGIGVDIAGAVAEAAAPGEIWVSRTVTDLVAGTGLEFDDRGRHLLRGLDQPWALFAARV